MKHSKRFQHALSRVESSKECGIADAVAKVKETTTAKFNESVDIAVRLGVDPKKSDQLVRGTVSLPHGIGKTVRVLVLCKPIKEQDAKDAGADYVGFEEYIKKIQEGWADVDVIVATPDVMGDVGRLGKVLGPRGLMPNPKSGTVTMDVAKAVKEVKAGKMEFRCDKAGIVHASVGRVSFEKEKLVDNINTFLDTLVKLRPSSSKGQYIKNITLSSTMGPGVRINKAEATTAR
jgi:large subunit ribosomal protein L1